jgi:hypothetical protein
LLSFFTFCLKFILFFSPISILILYNLCQLHHKVTIFVHIFFFELQTKPTFNSFSNGIPLLLSKLHPWWLFLGFIVELLTAFSFGLFHLKSFRLIFSFELSFLLWTLPVSFGHLSTLWLSFFGSILLFFRSICPY